MKCLLVVLAIAACAGVATAAAASCTLAEEFFSRHNISADDSDGPGAECMGHCCGRGREAQLRSALQRVAVRPTSMATRPIAELLLSTRRTLQEHLMSLSHQSQNKTALLFAQVYRGHATRVQSPLAALYDDIRILLRPTPDRDIDGENLDFTPPKNLEESARKFFRDIFPVAYHNVLRLDTKQFTPEYEICLKDAYENVQPFGDVPHKLGMSLSLSLESARALLQVLAVGASALTATEQILSNTNEECSKKLLRAGGCAHCRGHEARPCRNYCLNIARGCIGPLVAELDAPWAEYVEGVERLSKLDADATLRALDTKVSEAIMHALETQVLLERNMRQQCGAPSTMDAPEVTSPRPPPSTRRDALRAPPPDAELLQFAATLSESKDLFGRLADRVCDELEFSHESNDHCWNGETIGEYTQPLTASASSSDQKYNPEVASAAQDPRITALADKLRQTRQLLLSHGWSGEAPAAEAFMQGDEAGVEGSGSGRSYPDDSDDATYDAEGSGEEGSGWTPNIGGKSYSGEETTYSAPAKPTSAASLVRSLAVTFIVTTLSIVCRTLV